MKCFGCSRGIISPKNCSLCEKLFCSDSCVEAHQITYHRTSKNYMNKLNLHYPIKTESEKEFSSIFITEGIFSKIIKYNPIYKLENFIQEMDKNNKPRILGSGSYGLVYLSRNKINNKYYAIKHMDKLHLNKSLKTLSGIQTEIDLQSRISHPNIVQILYAHESKKSFDLVMECAFYGSLFDIIRKNKILPEEISFKFFIQIVNAIYFLHQNDLIHRDIKPENILVYENDNVKLCDFGWCVGLNGGQRGTFCGTTEYMAPEMVNQKVYSKEIDIWSLGVLLYEMLHGHSPFIPNKPRFNEREVMENIKIHNLKFNKKVSKECKELITHLLDENRKSRFKIEDIFNSSFVKKYEKLALNKSGITDINDNNKNQIYKTDYHNNDINQNHSCSITKKVENNNKNHEINENNNHPKCITNINNNILIENNYKNYENERNKKRGITPNVNNKMNKTVNHFHPKNINKNRMEINIKKINLDNKIGTPRKKFIDINNAIISGNNQEYHNINNEEIGEKKIIFDELNINNINEKNDNIKSEYNIYDNANKIIKNKEKTQEESFKIIPIIEEDKECSIIKNYTIETEKNSIKSNQNNKINNNSISNIISNYVNKNGNNNKEAYSRKIPVGNPKIASNKHYPNVKNKLMNNKQIKIYHLNKNYSNNNIKKKCVESNGEYQITNKNNNSPIKILLNKSNNENKNSNNNTKYKMKINLSSNLLPVNNNKYINNNNINNKTEIFDLKNKNLFINQVTGNYTDFNHNSFKNTPDPEFFINNNNPKNNILSLNKIGIGIDDTNTNDNINYINYVIINNNNNIISPNLNEDMQKKKIITKKENITNNIIIYPHSKISKTPIKKNTHKNLIKMEKETIDNEEDCKKDNTIHKSKIKSKSSIKNIIKKDIKYIKYVQEKKNSSNNIKSINMKPKILIEEKETQEKKDILNITKNLNTSDVNENKFDHINSINNDLVLNKTIKLKSIQKDSDDKIVYKQINNSFSGGKVIKKIKESENIVKILSPIKICGNNKKIVEEKNEINISENSNIIDEREFEVVNNDDEDQNKTPRKTTDKIKIFPCKLISEITKKFN